MTRTLPEIIRLLFNAAWRRRYLICVPFVLMIPISIIGSRYAPKTYEAKTIVLLQETGKDNPFLKDYVVGLNVKDRISALQALLRSEHVLGKVLRDIHGDEVAADPAKFTWMMRSLAGDISVQLVGTDLIELKIRSAKPTGLGKLLAAVSARFLERLLSPEQSTLSGTQEFLKEQKEQKRRELEAAELAAAQFKAENADKLPAVYATNVQRLGAMRQKLEEKSMELSAAEAAFSDLRNRLSSTNPIVGRLEESIVQVTSELTSLKSRYTDDHSEVQAAERKLQRLQEERRSYLDSSARISDADLERLWNMAAGQASSGDKTPPLLVSQMMRLQEAQAKRVALKKDVEQLRATVEDVQRDIARYAPIEQRQIQLDKEVASARELYETMLKRYENAATSRALSSFEAPERVKIIDAPQDPTVPVTPPPVIFMIAGIFAGVAIGIGLAVAAEVLDQRIRTAKDCLAVTEAPVLAILPRVGGADGAAAATV